MSKFACESVNASQLPLNFSTQSVDLGKICDIISVYPNIYYRKGIKLISLINAFIHSFFFSANICYELLIGLSME